MISERVKFFINIANGIEWLKDFPLQDVSFVRIQSTACEQKRWDFVLQDLDHNLLIHLALGYRCIILDASKKGISRAVWQGIEWVRYALNRAWFGREINAWVKSNNVTEYFRNEYNKLDKKVKAKLKYYKKFLLADYPEIYGISIHTDMDGKYNYFRNILKKGV